MNVKEYFYHPTVCPLPWSGFILYPNGDIKNCSISNDVLGNIFKDENIEDILSGLKNQKIKQDMLDSIETSSCSNCWDRENKSSKVLGGSNRDHFKRQLDPKKIIKIVEDAKQFELAQVDLRWRNTCNLACVYCDSLYSSTWAKELKQDIKTPDEISIDQVKKFVFDRSSQLDSVYLCGGEPLLMKENLELLDILEKENPTVKIRVNTNLTNIQSGIYKKLLTFKNVHWIVSVETIEEYFEFVRYGANWNSWKENLIQLKLDAEKYNHKITFNMTWGAVCSDQIFDAIDYFTNLGFHPNSFFINLLVDPPKLDINALKLESRIKIADTLISRINTLATDSWLLTSYKTMLEHINQSSEKNLISEFTSYLEELDARRNTKGLELYSDLL